jgi:hypothetical protein
MLFKIFHLHYGIDKCHSQFIYITQMSMEFSQVLKTVMPRKAMQ